MNRFKLIILAVVLFVPIETFTSKPNSLAETKIVCRNTSNLSYKTYLGRRGFLGWLNDDFSDSIRAYDEYLKCFAKTKEEIPTEEKNKKEDSSLNEDKTE